MRTRTRTILAGLALVALLGGGAAWATIPGATGVVQGCYTTSNGNLRVVESADQCRNSETAISWNQKGQTGPAGANGTNGTDGKDGAAGPKGADGTVGTNGVDGTNGTNGAPGAKGDPCLATDPACIGPKGENGANGTNGAPGAKGDPCLAVDPACVGPGGDAGAPGTNGADGAKGEKGDQGETGPTGPAGAGATYTIRRTNSNGSSATAFCLPGEHVTGGGAYINNATGLIANNPVDATGNAATSQTAEVRGWRATRSSGIDGTFAVVYVMCAS